MNRLQAKQQHAQLRQRRIRAVVTGTAKRPRLAVDVSLRQVRAQLIDDSAHKTILAVSSQSQKELSPNLQAKAEWVGAEIAKKAKLAKVSQVVFDRRGRLYHGRVKALAEAARKNGLEF